MTHDEIMQELAEDITNRVDGAGSDLRYADWDGSEWLELSGALDISALASTVQRLMDEDVY